MADGILNPTTGDALRDASGTTYHVSDRMGEIVFYRLNDEACERSLPLENWRVLRKGCTVVSSEVRESGRKESK